MSGTGRGHGERTAKIAPEAVDRILHVLRRESPGARELDEGALRLLGQERLEILAGERAEHALVG